MKTVNELKAMNFIPHHECAICHCMVGWYPQSTGLWFDSSCGCGGDGGHYDTWEEAFKWYNTVFEHESEDAVDSAWRAEGTGNPVSPADEPNAPSDCCTDMYTHAIRMLLDEQNQEIPVWQLRERMQADGIDLDCLKKFLPSTI